MKRLMLLLAGLAFCGCVTLTAHAQTFVRHPRTFKTGPNPCAIAAHDLNGDALPEIITADRGNLGPLAEEKPANDEISLFVATGRFEYRSPRQTLRCGFAPWAITIANMDALKAQDLIIANFHASRQRNLSLFLNIGSNEQTGELLFKSLDFTVPEQFTPYKRHRDADDAPVFSAPGITAAVAGYFNGDDYRDIVATGWSSDVLLFFPGTVDTILGTPSVIPAPGGPRDVCAADFDENKTQDLATTMYNSNEIVLWRNNASGAFEEADRIAVRRRLPHKVRAGDINGDGHADFVVSFCHTDAYLCLFYGNGDLTFPVTQEIAFGGNPILADQDIRDIILDDLNGDGRLDIAAACAASSQVVVAINTSKDENAIQTFNLERYSFKALKGRPRALCAADLDGDEKKDLAVALWEIDSVAILKGR